MRQHWPEYIIEATGLGLFMLSACLFATLLEHPGSPARQAVTNAMLRRIPMGLAMGLTAVAIIYSPWGQRSGAHLNPSVTLAFWRLGKVGSWDAAFYMAAQLAGAIVGVGVAAVALGPWVAHPAVRYAVTVPGANGAAVAFAAEFLMTFGLMAVVLAVSNRPDLNRFTGLWAGALVAGYIVLEAPLSGMSLNPARTVGSAVYAQMWTALWLYLTAPLLGMLAAAQVYVATRAGRPVLCAKLHHENRQRCIFQCDYRVPAHSRARRGGMDMTTMLETEPAITRSARNGHTPPGEQPPPRRWRGAMAPLWPLGLARIIYGYLWWQQSGWKVPSDDFGRKSGGGLWYWIQQGIQSPTLSAYRDFQVAVIIPHWTFFGWMTLITETLIGVTLILGLGTRLGSLAAIGMAANITVSILSVPHEWGWTYTMLIMFPVLFFLADAGRTLGVDAFLVPPIDRAAARGSRLARLARWLV
jgi:aquaporin Z